MCIIVRYCGAIVVSKNILLTTALLTVACLSFSFSLSVTISTISTVKMRAMADGPPLSPGFFIIMDRLYETLDVRLKQWAKTHCQYKGVMFGVGCNKTELESLLVERLVVAYDLSAAFHYIHSHRQVLSVIILFCAFNLGHVPQFPTSSCMFFVFALDLVVYAAWYTVILSQKTLVSMLEVM
jgi:hypothetical protein